MWTPRGRHDDSAPWNVLVTGQEGVAGDLLRQLKKLGRFRWAGFRNVIIGQVDDVEAFLQTLQDLMEQKPFVEAWLGKAVPIDATFQFSAEEFLADVERELTPFLDRLAGRTFYVRVERRGHKGVLRTAEIEQEIGAFLVRALTERGHSPKVKFDDPDVVLDVEILGDRAGISLITRELRTRFTSVKIR